MGWLTEHSAAYRSYLGIRNAMNSALVDSRRARAPMSPLGFVALDTVRPAGGAMTPAPSSQPIAAPALEGLDRLLGLRQRAVEVVLVELPTSPRWDAADRDAFAAQMMALARERGALWLTVPRDLVPPGGWADDVHLNVAGAARFSAWLGGRLGAASADAS